MKLIVRGVEMESFIETPLYGLGKLLLGRRVLSKLDVALLGKKAIACYLQEESHRSKQYGFIA